MNIIITGAGRGIGYGLALKFACEDANKIIAISRNIEAIESLSAGQRKGFHENAEILPLSFDLTTISHQKEPFLNFLNKNKINHIDILINNAGQLINRFFEKSTLDDAKALFDVNFHAPAELIRTLLPFFKIAPRPHILNISSMGGFQGSAKFKGLAYYSASKAALASLTECLAEEHKNDGIAFNCLALGAVQTEMLNEAFPGYKAPLSAAEMAKFIYNFAVTGHHFINGKIIPVSLSTP